MTSDDINGGSAASSEYHIQLCRSEWSFQWHCRSHTSQKIKVPRNINIYIYKLCLHAVPRPYSKQLKWHEIQLDSPQNVHHHSQKGSVRIPKNLQRELNGCKQKGEKVRFEEREREMDCGHRCYDYLLKTLHRIIQQIKPLVSLYLFYFTVD